MLPNGCLSLILVPPLLFPPLASFLCASWVLGPGALDPVVEPTPEPSATTSGLRGDNSGNLGSVVGPVPSRMLSTSLLPALSLSEFVQDACGESPTPVACVEKLLWPINGQAPGQTAGLSVPPSRRGDYDAQGSKRGGGRLGGGRSRFRALLVWPLREYLNNGGLS